MGWIKIYNLITRGYIVLFSYKKDPLRIEKYYHTSNALSRVGWSEYIITNSAVYIILYFCLTLSYLRIIIHWFSKLSFTGVMNLFVFHIISMEVSFSIHTKMYKNASDTWTCLIVRKFSKVTLSAHDLKRN